MSRLRLGPTSEDIGAPRARDCPRFSESLRVSEICGGRRYSTGALVLMNGLFGDLAVILGIIEFVRPEKLFARRVRALHAATQTGGSPRPPPRSPPDLRRPPPDLRPISPPDLPARSPCPISP